MKPEAAGYLPTAAMSLRHTEQKIPKKSVFRMEAVTTV
jgi:hypothetical protein